jgi:acetyl-CoA hydrolase
MPRIVDAANLDLSEIIRPGDGLIWGQACAEPLMLVEALAAQRAALGPLEVFMGVNWSGTIKAEHADHLRLTAYCGAGHNRKLADAGVLDICPYPYSQIGPLIRAGKIKTDVVLLQVSPPNARGEYSLGLDVEYLAPAIDCARSVVAEINQHVPWTTTERLMRAEDFALMIESSRPPVAPPYGAPGEVETRIARHAAQFIPDGATLEFGLGSLPDAILAALGDRRDLGVHSGLLCDGIARLSEQGVITNARKSIDRGVTVGGVLMGSKILLDFAHLNPRLQLRSSEYTHHPATLSRIERFVAVNSAVEVDLTGQVNAEIAGGSYVGAIGGQLDFVRAASISPGGVSLICLPASIGTKISRIVARLSAPVATPRSEAGVFVTEWGAADLRGLPLSKRAERMIAIAHPAFREELERAAHKPVLPGG